MGLFAELQRRNVFRVGAAYIVTAWLVAQVAELVLEAFHAPTWVLKALLLLLGLGFLVALVFAWAYELTPEGIKRESEVNRDESVTRVTGRRLDRAIIGILALVIVFLAAERLLLANREAPDRAASSAAEVTPAEADKSVAVLPFADLSESQDQEWFADGLAEEILNALARTPDLLVSSRTSSFKYKGSSIGVPQIAKELGVAHVLEGSVRRSGDRIRVTAQLIRAADGFHVWSENYDRTTADVITIQEDLAQKIARALETSMDPAALAGMATAGTRSVEAYLEYLQGRAALAGQGRARFRQAYDHFERARTIDPGFARAHYEAAIFWDVQLSGANVLIGATDLPIPAMLQNFHERLDAAIARAPTEVDRQGYQARKAGFEMRIRDAIRLYGAYLAERPGDDSAWEAYLPLLVAAREYELGRTALEQVWKRAQQFPSAALSYGGNAYVILPPGEAADRVVQLANIHAGVAIVVYQAHRTLLWAGRTEEASQLLLRLPPVDSAARFLPAARQACAAGDRGPAEAALARLSAEEDPTGAIRWHLLKLLGLDDEAVEMLQPLERGGIRSQLGDFLDYMQFDPRPYPGLMAILERESIEPNQPVEIPFACPPPDNTVAVLPFVNMSGDAAQEYFSDGMTEELINTLVRVSGLEVAARTSVFAFKGRQADVRAIGRELGVGHVLEGSVRSDGERLRITAQLIKVDDGFHLWSETFDRKMENIFAVQEDIAAAIAGVLTDKLKLETTARSARTSDLDAYDAYLQGRALLRGRQNLAEALELFRQATAADPGFAPAWAAMAIAADVENEHDDAERYALTALELDPENVDALNALGAVYRDTWRWAEAEAVFKRALALDPRSSELLEDYAEFLASVGRSADQVRVAGLGYGIDPYLAPLAEVYITGLLSMSQLDRAREVLTAALETSSLIRLRGVAVELNLTAGDVETAISHAQQIGAPPEVIEAFSRYVRDPGDDAARQRLEHCGTGEAPADGPTALADCMLSMSAMLYAGQGELLIERLLAEPNRSNVSLPEQFFTPLFATVRQTDRFGTLLERVGLPAYWDATQWPEACERIEDGAIRCR